MEKLLGRARWFDHPNAVQAGPLLRQWLADPGSMTFKLRARCDELRVQRLRQRPGNALQDECRLLGLTPREAVEERDVILHCDGHPVLFGHTVTPLASAAAWPFFRRLGNRPLGGSLFSDPLVTRAPIQFARLHAGHPLVRRVRQALDLHSQPPLQPLYARRSLFRRHGSVMLVTDVFLPALSTLMALNM
ncbi:chorismate--pyruvate lyase family protein [Herbaspirillum rhizosphaerae]|uniref:chorismate--pyruvate lyase family protein n=1 Tax=Herbaspirillum rhizosphaerae TaxID=346179 RepID=UPI00067BBB72|nr:chorismate lyase [Herbaspirillum rhizosphaerae]